MKSIIVKKPTVKDVDDILLSIASYKAGKTELYDTWAKLLKLRDKVKNVS